MAPKFRLLLHGQDGSLPYLTPELIRLIFPSATTPSNNEGSTIDNTGVTSNDAHDYSNRHDDDLKEHLILGVAVKDTCVTPLYREDDKKTALKRKRGEGADNNGAETNNNNSTDNCGSLKEIKRKKIGSENNDDDAVPPMDSKISDSKSTSIINIDKNDGNKNKPNCDTKTDNNSNSKKPAGYKFLTPLASSKICHDIQNQLNNFNHRHGKEECNNDPETIVNNNDDDKEDSKNKWKKEEGGDGFNFMHKHLRIPKFISTLVVPTFSFCVNADSIHDDDDDAIAGKGNEGDKDTSNPMSGKSDTTDRKGYTPKQPSQKVKQNQKHNIQNKNVIPKSTKDAVSIQTPHGWQNITPEQYWDAVDSMMGVYPFSNTVTPSSSDVGSPTSKMCSTITSIEGGYLGKVASEGAVGLFDHVDITTAHVRSLLLSQQQGTSSSVSSKNETDNAGNNDDHAVLVKQAFKKVGVSVQKTNSWTIRISNQSNESPLPLWAPIHILSPSLPRFQLASVLSDFSNIAICGWDILPSCSSCKQLKTQKRVQQRKEYQLQRRGMLHKLIALFQTSNASTSGQLQFLLLSVNDIQSILDAARENVSIIGTNVATKWSRARQALVLDLSLNNMTENDTDDEQKEKNGTHTNGGLMDLKDEQYARDALPILPGCKCLACRPRASSRSLRPLGYRHFQKNTGITNKTNPPSFSRSYIHHLIVAKEMLAETLVFVHNLHQLLLLVRQLSIAASLDESGDISNGDGKKETISNLELFCQKVECQL